MWIYNNNKKSKKERKKKKERMRDLESAVTNALKTYIFGIEKKKKEKDEEEDVNGSKKQILM